MKVMMFNPYTGKPRHPLDIQSDPKGVMVIEPGAPLLASKPSQDPWACLHEQVSTMPSRLEPIGGQQTRYVQLDEVLGWIDHWRKCAELSNVR